MNKKMMLVLLLSLITPLIVKAETCEPEKVTIQSVEINTKTDNVTEKSSPVFKNRDLNLDLKMIEVGDSIEYKMIVKNDSDDDYELDKTSLNSSSDHIEYTFDMKDNDKIIKAGETKEVYLRVQYKNEVSPDSFTNGIYHDNKNLMVNLETEETNPITNIISNPKTGQSFAITIILFITISTSIIMLLRKKKYSKIMILVIAASTIIPIGVYAICKCNITVDSNVEIVQENPKFCIEYSPSDFEERTKYLEFEEGMTWENFIESEYNVMGNQKILDYYEKNTDLITPDSSNYCSNVIKDNNQTVTRNDRIKNKKEGCYQYYQSIC